MWKNNPFGWFENNFIQMAALADHKVALNISPIFKNIIDCVHLFSTMSSRILSFKTWFICGLEEFFPRFKKPSTFAIQNFEVKKLFHILFLGCLMEKKSVEIIRKIVW